MSELIGCFSSDFSKPDNYCKAIQHLLDEHPLLKNKMKDFYYIASHLAYKPTRADRRKLLDDLYNEVQVFYELMKKHAFKEEDYLFQLLTRYIGAENGPISSMEQEHLVVKENITLFIEKYTNVNINNPDEIREMTHYISIIFHTLTDHLLKEEEILFPLAEQLLSEKEKQQLEDVVNSYDHKKFA
ncbi:hemerythrin domain-containing protein [Evansella sp. AB-P1]|uniref:hemerythrin domain-containing protein n=1 Tax=Evansella sp. AB-P1 TaxID=3037653 RepID=UPI00241CA120|nr:hemerythrin domain-containing protein [Evansella sp. AB-P1]MDG5789187.1 hemerythrin domain-containing protein [Evansella sp. AB-P1]